MPNTTGEGKKGSPNPSDVPHNVVTTTTKGEAGKDWKGLPDSRPDGGSNYNKS